MSSNGASVTVAAEDARARAPDHAGMSRLLRRGASGAFIVSVAGTGLGLLANLVMARLIGRAQYGIYALMFSWIGVLMMVAQAGQDISIIRFLPTYIQQKAWGKVRGLRVGVGLFVLATSVGIALVGCAVVFVLGAGHSATWRDTFYIGFAMLPILTQLQQSSAMHRAFKRPVITGLYSSVMRPLVLLALLGIAAIVTVRRDAPLASVCVALAALLALLASGWHLTRAWPEQGRGATPSYDARRWIKVGGQLSLLSIVIVGGAKLDVMLLGAIMGTRDVGPYYAAVKMATFAFFASRAVNVVLAPMIAERYDAGDMRGLQSVAVYGARIALAGSLAVALFCVVAGNWVLGLFGHGFDVAYVPLLILLAGYCLSTAFGEVGFMLSMTRYQKQASVFVVIGICANCITAVLLVPRLGATGAAIGAGLSLVVWRGLAWWFVRRHMGVEPSVFGKYAPGGSALR
ncbi:MAG TPA: oligosaccharide flippase family protein [Rhodanobacteraceae bacterium]